MWATRLAFVALVVVPFLTPGTLDAEPTLPEVTKSAPGLPSGEIPDLLSDTFSQLVHGPGRFPGAFRTTAIQGVAAGLPLSGNSLEGFRLAYEEGVQSIEADFRLDADDTLVATHDEKIGGNCGEVSTTTTKQLEGCRLPNGYHVATLPQLLRIPFRTIHLDMKDTGLIDLKPVDPTRAVRAVERAIADVREAGRTDSVVVMVYDTPGAAERLSRERGIRGGLKGYPSNTEQTLRMNKLAAFYGFELVCVSVKQVTAQVVADAARLGVYHLPYGELDTPTSVLEQKAAIGIGGVITPNYKIVANAVPSHWVPPQRFAK